MFDDMDSAAFDKDQGGRAQKMFAAVVLAALDDAIADDKKYGNGAEVIARWARSRDGREVLMCAGIEPTERAVKGMIEFVRRGVRTSVALSREESERKAHKQHQKSRVIQKQAREPLFATGFFFAFGFLLLREIGDVFPRLLDRFLLGFQQEGLISALLVDCIDLRGRFEHRTG